MNTKKAHEARAPLGRCLKSINFHPDVRAERERERKITKTVIFVEERDNLFFVFQSYIEISLFFTFLKSFSLFFTDEIYNTCIIAS